MASVVFDEVTRVYPTTGHTAVNSLSLTIHDGEFLVLVGPSGCGKSTTLRMLAGLEETDSGKIYIDGRDVTQLPPRDRDVAMIFQNYALYPHMTVAENIGFALKIAGLSQEEIRQRVELAAQVLGLSEYLDVRPKALSGGQRQRVAMGRAIVRQPQVFLMDEPLSNLDAKLRAQTRMQIAELQQKLNVTTLYVTHDQTEAMTMGDRIAVMNQGVLQQVGTPNELYNNPANAFVASFIGSPVMNLGRFAVHDSAVTIGEATITLPENVHNALSLADQSDVIVGIRAEHIVIDDCDVAVPQAVQKDETALGGGVLKSSTKSAHYSEPITITVRNVENLGAQAFVYAAIGNEDSQELQTLTHDALLVVACNPRALPSVGDVLSVRLGLDFLHFFSAATGERLS